MRNKRLDILRCIAVVLVMIHHSGMWTFFTRVGWLGVDLFFVLSGFLISGLLFSEYKRRTTISLKRFFIRRGLKIYPAFYVFLLLTGIISYAAFRTASTPARYVHEVLFVMNYEQGVWDHTWTLAIEEHFYIFLPIFLLILVHFSSRRENPFRVVPWASAVIAVMCVAFRAVSAYVGALNFHMTYAASHERMDSLFFGVLLGYLYHFRPIVLERLMVPAKNRAVIAVVSAMLLSFAYFYSRGDKFFATVGYSFIYLGLGGVLLLSLYVHGALPGQLARVAARIGNSLAYVGMYSYSIYLWHGPCAAWLPGFVRRVVHSPTGRYGRFGVYFAGSIVVGIAMSKLIEYPILRLRDRFFPAAQAVPVSPEAAIVTPAISNS
ncbi:MAG TPA: acyltransferase [Candidatus Dormibacteraeota bacterium]|nr:acyltransferase [Candidatus Dormibacteraeota bacterium]